LKLGQSTALSSNNLTAIYLLFLFRSIMTLFRKNLFLNLDYPELKLA